MNNAFRHQLGLEVFFAIRLSKKFTPRKCHFVGAGDHFVDKSGFLLFCSAQSNKTETATKTTSIIKTAAATAAFPHVTPNPGKGGGGPYWCGFIVQAPWRTYVDYADIRQLELNYDAMKLWLTYVDAYTVDGLLKRWPDTSYRDWYLGDWLAPKGVDTGAQSSIDLVNNCFVSECLGMLQQVAARLGRPDEARGFAERRGKLNGLIHETFYDPQIPRGVTWAEVTKESPYGTIGVEYNVMRPANLLWASNDAAVDTLRSQRRRNPFVRVNTDYRLRFMNPGIREDCIREQGELVDRIYTSNRPRPLKVELTR